MKKTTMRNLILGIIAIIILLISSHYEYRCETEGRQSTEDIKEANAEQAFYEYHNNYR